MDDPKESTLDPSKGGRVRAELLSPNERREIAIRAAEARWGNTIPRATHTGVLQIGDATLECAVLDDGTRVLSQETFLKALGRSPKGKGGQVAISSADGLPPFVAAESIKPFVSEELRKTTVPIVYRALSGRRAHGYRAQLLPMVCEVYLRARDDHKTTKQQAHIVRAADVLMRGLAHVGIIALVDEATGYQDLRARDALAQILERFITEELRPWVKTFPLEYYRGIYRLRGWSWPPKSNKHNSNLGKYTNDLVYDRLAPGVKDELNRLTPRNEKGRLKHRLFQHLTSDVGHPKLREHLGAVVMALRMSETWDDFMRTMNKHLPKFAKMPLFEALNRVEQIAMGETGHD
jgi:hypothetical protein